MKKRKQSILKNMQKTLYNAIIVLCFTSILFTGCKTETPDNQATPNVEEQAKDPISKQAFKLNTLVSLTIYDSDNLDLLDECLDLCDYYENLFSRTKEGTEISQLNETGNFVISDKTLDLINAGLYYCELSNGTFDITIEPISSIWDFTSDNRKVPSSDQIKEALSHVNYKNILIEDHLITLSESKMGLDLGAIAKGFIADRMKDFLLSHGVKSALINLGGNVLLVGSKPNGSDFTVGIQAPFEDRNEIIAKVRLSDMTVVTSGVYERYFIENDRLYHHLLNTKDGYPHNNGLVSVSIICKYSVDGDGLSTSAFTLGLEKGMELINSLEDTYAIFITTDGELHYSDGFMENIVIVE